MERMDLEVLCSALRDAAEDAAEFIRSQVGRVALSQIESKEKNSLVSYVDKEAERILVEKLTPIVPNPGFITEEDTVDNSQEEYTWIIDPLDGTTNFLQGLPMFSVSVGLVHNGEVVAGCVVDIMQNDTYYAWKGGGAWLNGIPIKVSGTTDLSESIISTGFPYYKPHMLHKLAVLFHDVLLSVRGVRRIGSAALDMTYVAAGKLDAFYETDLNAWDIAAGTILVREAGGLVTDFSGGGDFVEKQQIIVSNGALHDGLKAIINKNGAV